MAPMTELLPVPSLFDDPVPDLFNDPAPDPFDDAFSDQFNTGHDTDGPDDQVW